MTTPASDGIVMARGRDEAKPAAMMSAPAQSCHSWCEVSSAKATKQSDESSISELRASTGGRGVGGGAPRGRTHGKGQVREGVGANRLALPGRSGGGGRGGAPIDGEHAPA